jgi:hypothetical protein
MADEPERLALLECAVCSALIEVYRHVAPKGDVIAWNMRYDETCQNPPSKRCPQVRAEIRRRFPEGDIPESASDPNDDLKSSARFVRSLSRRSHSPSGRETP